MKRTALQWLAISSIAIGMISPAMARTRPRYGGTARVQVRGEALNDDTRALITETLTAVDESGRVQPKLAMRWESQSGDRRWQFWIRSGVQFHDGTQLTAAHVVKALTSGECETCPWKTVRALNDSVVFESDVPMPQLAARLALPQFANTRTEGNTLLGTGPFRLASGGSGAVKLEAFDDYWQGRAYLDGLEIAGRRRDSIDGNPGVSDVTELAAEQLRRAQQNHLRAVASRPMDLIVLSIGTSSLQLQDARARQAVAESIDRASLLNVVYQKQGEITGSVLPQWMTGYGFLFPAGQNMAHARDLRRGANANGTITLAYYEGNSALQLVAERVALNAREAGFNLQTMVRNPDTRADMYISTVRLPSFEGAVAIDEIRSRFTGPEVSAQPVTPEQLFLRQREALASYNIVPLLYLPRAFAATERVRNWRLDASGAPDHANEWLEQRR